MLRASILAITLAFAAVPATSAQAGCITGAIVGGIAGHLVGHGAVGAAAGCAIGHHRASVRRYGYVRHPLLHRY